jgi:molybdenum-dependent DNA-binding transcriptional regulator ModE
MAKRGSVTPKVKVWVVLAGSVKFGDGRAELLERVESLGS